MTSSQMRKKFQTFKNQFQLVLFSIFALLQSHCSLLEWRIKSVRYSRITYKGVATEFINSIHS